MDRSNDHITTAAGLTAAIVAHGDQVMTILGILIGLGGLICGVSREARAWLDRHGVGKGSNR